jgi:excisionase family DNA binding protein
MSLKISEVARILNVHPQTLRRWENEGKIKPIRVNGQRRYNRDEIEQLQSGDEFQHSTTRTNVIYCRVSSRKQESDLQRQVKFMQRIYPNDEVITDVGSGVNFKRPGMQALLERVCSGEIGRIAIAYKDRLARIGYDLFKQIAKIFGCEIVVVNNVETSPEEELVEDLITITTSFSARVHGLRKYADQMSDDKITKKIETGQDMEELDENFGDII